jgi:hypothetical protein
VPLPRGALEQLQRWLPCRPGPPGRGCRMAPTARTAGPGPSPSRSPGAASSAPAPGHGIALRSRSPRVQAKWEWWRWLSGNARSSHSSSSAPEGRLRCCPGSALTSRHRLIRAFRPRPSPARPEQKWMQASWKLAFRLWPATAELRSADRQPEGVGWRGPVPCILRSAARRVKGIGWQRGSRPVWHSAARAVGLPAVEP